MKKYLKLILITFLSTICVSSLMAVAGCTGDNNTGDGNSGSKHQHTFSAVITPPSCQERGFTTYTCECGYSYTDNYTNPAHQYSHYKCVECGYIDTNNVTTNLQFEYFEDINEYGVSGVATNSSVIVIPSLYNDKGVTIICENAFKDNTNITEVIMPDTISQIEDSAFENCTQLKDVMFSKNLLRIESTAFKGCTSINELNLPQTVNSVGVGAFRNCSSMKSITMPKNLTRIYDNAFWGCTNLTSIEIPENVEYIGYNAFYYCRNLETVFYNAIQCTSAGYYYKAGNFVTNYTIFQGCTDLTTVVIGEKVEAIPCFTFWGCTSLINAKFENVKTWLIYNDSNIYSSYIKTISADNLSNSYTAAKYLSSSYSKNFWRKRNI